MNTGRTAGSAPVSENGRSGDPVNRLQAAGLVHRLGDFVFAARPALHAARLQRLSIAEIAEQLGDKIPRAAAGRTPPTDTGTR